MALKTIIIVLNWNGLHDTTECVKSLESITLKVHETLRGLKAAFVRGFS